jgi:hypothetical protein
VPSGENCQPWAFRWDGNKLSVIHLPDRAQNQINYKGFVSLFSLGFLFETLRVAASAEGLVPHFTNLFDPDRPICAEVWFEPAGVPVDPLFPMLDRRFTDRRPFLKGTVPADLVSATANDAKDTGCSFYWSEKPTEEFLRWTCEAESFFWYNDVFHRDYTRWIRLTTKEALATRDGIPWWSLGVPYLVSRLLIPLKSYKVQEFGNSIGFLKITKNVLRKQVKSSAAVCCITIRSVSPDTVLQAGQLGMRVWLRCNQCDFGFHPLSLAALLSHYSQIGVADHLYPGLSEKGRRGVAALRNCFKYPDNEIPLWLFRTGRTVGFPGERRTLRLDTSELLSFVDAAGVPVSHVRNVGADKG